MNESNKVTAVLAAAAVTGLLAGVASASPLNGMAGKRGLLLAQAGTPAPFKKPKHVNPNGNACSGKNACKGKGGCFSSDNGCKGKNSCKGKGGCGTGGTGDKSGKTKPK